MFCIIWILSLSKLFGTKCPWYCKYFQHNLSIVVHSPSWRDRQNLHCQYFSIAMLQSVTTPGTKRDSPHHEVIFVRGEQAGIGCYLAEYLMDWTQLMEIILRGLETAASGAGTQDTFRDALAANIEKRVDTRLELSTIFREISKYSKKAPTRASPPG